MIAVLTALVVKGWLLVIAAASVVALMRRASAAARHFVWTLTVIGLLVLPMLVAVLPTWSIAVPIAPAARSLRLDAVHPVFPPAEAPRASTDSVADVNAGTPLLAGGNDLPWAMLPGAIYVLGLVMLLGRLAVERAAARRIVRESAVVADGQWRSQVSECAARTGITRRVVLCRSRAQLMPMTTGTFAPVIVIPADADTWDEPRRRAVLLHELAHIARLDCLTQMLSAVACAVYWCHPGVWYVARRLRIERELACDDRVLAAGTEARDYAGHLLEIAYTWSGRRAPALVVGMSSSRKLEGRMRAVLDPARDRTTPSRRVWLTGAAVGAAFLFPLAALTMTAVSADVQPLTEAQDPPARDQERVIGAQDATTGTWEIRRGQTRYRVSLRIRAGDSSFNSDVDVSTLDGVLPQPLANLNGRTTFTIRREAGSFFIDGTIKSGAGSGSFRFEPSQIFITGLTGRGFERPTAAELMTFATANIGFAFIDELAAQKYARPAVSDLVRAAHHGVDLEFLESMRGTGYRLGTLDMLIRFRDHGVTPEYIRGLNAQGVRDLSPDDLVRSRDHGIGPEYVSAMRQAGYRPAILDLIRARDHGVTPDYIAALRESGYSSLGLQDVIRARDHGVNREYLRDMRELGFTVTLSELINARDHGVTPDYVVALDTLGYKNLPIDTLIRMRDHGVTPEYVLETLKLRGIDKPSVDELIRLRDRGVASGREREIRDALARLAERFENLLRQLDERARNLR